MEPSVAETPKRIPEAIYVTEYMHPDHAWCHARAWHEHRYVESLLQVLDLLKREPGFRFYVDTYHEELLPFVRAYPERLGELHEQMLAGRIGVGLCGYSNPRPVDVTDELLVRNMAMGRRLFEQRFPGVDLSVCTIHDVPPGPSQMPQILRKAGFAYYAFSRPLDAMQAKGVAPEFLWRGADGTEIACSCRMYGSMWVPDQFPHDYAADWEKAKAWLTGIFAEVTGPSGLAWLHRGSDDSLPLRAHWLYGEPPLDILGLFARWNGTETPQIEWGTPANYFRRLGERTDRLPVFEGAIDPAGWTFWHGHLGQESLFVYHARITEKLTALEKLVALTGNGSDAEPNADAEERLADYWRRLLRTVGHAQLWLFAEDYQRLHEQVRRLERDVDAHLQSAMAAVRPAHPATGGEVQISLFNPHAWVHEEVVAAPVTFAVSGDVRAFALREASGAVIPHQISDVDSRDDGALRSCTVVFPARLAPLGFTHVRLVPIEPAAEATLDQRLSVLEAVSPPARLALKSTMLGLAGGKLYGTPGAAPGEKPHRASDGAAEPASPDPAAFPPPLFDLVFQTIDEKPGSLHFGPYGERSSFTPTAVRVLEDGPVRTRIWVRGKLGPHTAEHLYDVSPFSDVVRVETRLFATGVPGEFRLAFPVQGEPTLQAGAHFGHEPRELSGEPYVGVERWRTGSFYAHRWLGIGHAGGGGLAVFSAPGNQGWLKTDSTVEHILLKSLTLAEEGWESQCSGIREGKGVHVFHWGFVHLTGAAPEITQGVPVQWEALHRRALSFHAPVPATAGPAPAATSAAESGLDGSNIEPDHVAVSALYRHEGRLLIRLYEFAGKGAPVRLRLAGLTVRAAREVDFNGATIASGRLVEVEEGGVSLSLARWEIVTLELEA
ncbi:MAG TPA: glycosyl hydrolase-related protein [Limnochordia bacterium]|nr:glycosyl hydrolase-related protein [Limnochordia bacterium]